MQNSPFPIPDFMKGIFFKTNLTLNSAASRQTPNPLDHWISYTIKKGEKIRNILKEAIALIVTMIKEKTESPITRSLT